MSAYHPDFLDQDRRHEDLEKHCDLLSLASRWLNKTPGLCYGVFGEEHFSQDCRMWYSLALNCSLMLIPPQKHHQSLWRHEPSHTVKIVQSFFAESLLLRRKKNMAISAIDVYWYFMVLPCIFQVCCSTSTNEVHEHVKWKAPLSLSYPSL